MVEIRRLDARQAREHAGALAAVLVDCVEGGASISFMDPLSHDDAAAFFSGVADDVEAGRKILLGAFDDDELVGTVQVLLAMPPNQPHRGDIKKLLVHRAARHHGIGAALMARAEAEAKARGRTLLVLDTASGDAERLYARGGWQRVGVIPDYAMWPGGGFCDTTVFWKRV